MPLGARLFSQQPGGRVGSSFIDLFLLALTDGRLRLQWLIGGRTTIPSHTLHIVDVLTRCKRTYNGGSSCSIGNLSSLLFALGGLGTFDLQDETCVVRSSSTSLDQTHVFFFWRSVETSEEHISEVKGRARQLCLDERPSGVWIGPDRAFG